MVLAWRLWCGLCGALPNDSFVDLRKDKDLMDLAVRCFLSSLGPKEPLSVCPECFEFVQKLKAFGDTCATARTMMLELKKNSKLRSDDHILEFRKNYLEKCIKKEVIKEEIPDEITETAEDDPDLINCAAAAPVDNNLIYEMDGDADDLVDNDGDNDDDYEEEGLDELLEEEEDVDDDEELEEEEEVEETGKKNRSKRKKGDSTTDRARCEPCQMVFRFKYQLKTHNKKVHPGLRPFVCEECGKGFRVYWNLSAHVATHKTNTIHQCSTCSKEFQSERSLKKHRELHSSDKWVCPNCGILLNSRNTYLRHMKVHSDEKNHKCQICGKLFKRHKTLKDHLIIHSGLRPYKCPFCDKTFVNGANCRSHKLKNHPVELAQLEASGMNETVLKECRNIPRVDELIAVSLQRINGEGTTNPDLLQVRTAGRPPHDAWAGFTRKMFEDPRRHAAECNDCHTIIYSTDKKKMVQHKSECPMSSGGIVSISMGH